MKWCCAQFQGWYSEAGNRGVGVFARKNLDGNPYFVLQHRATEANVQVTTNPVSPVSLVAEVGIQFCPWCGVRLLDWYRKSVELLERPDLGVNP